MEVGRLGVKKFIPNSSTKNRDEESEEKSGNFSFSQLEGNSDVVVFPIRTGSEKGTFSFDFSFEKGDHGIDVIMTKCYDSMYTIDSDTVQHQTLQEFDGVTQIGTPSFVHHQLADDQLRTPIPFRSSLIIGRKLLA